MTLELVSSEPAERDIDEIHAHLHSENPAAAVKTVERIFEVIGHLAEFPDMGRVGRVLGTREMVVSDTRYIIAYRATTTAIEVARVIHHAMQWPGDL